MYAEFRGRLEFIAVVFVLGHINPGQKKKKNSTELQCELQNYKYIVSIMYKTSLG